MFSAEFRASLQAHGRRKPKAVGPIQPTGDDPDDRVDPDDCAQEAAGITVAVDTPVSDQLPALLFAANTAAASSPQMPLNKPTPGGLLSY